MIEPSETPSSEHVNPIVRFAVERRVTMAMGVIGVLVLGWLSLDRLPLEFLPSFSASFLSVNAPYPSSSPEETERLIVRPLEDSLGTINGIDTLTAVATAQSGSVSLRFFDGTDMDLAAVEVRDRVDRVRARLPSDLQRVEIRRFQTSDRPVFRFNLSGPWDRDRLYRFVDDVVVRRLQRLDGAADVQVRGVETRQLQVNLVPDRLAAHGVEPREVSALVRSNHLTRSVGVVRDGSQAFLVRAEGKLRTLEEFRALPLRRGLRLGDVAEVSLSYPEREEYEYLNGSEAVSVNVYKASTANLLELIDGVKVELDAIRRLPEAEGLSLNVYRDDSKDVREGLGDLRDTGLLGGGLAIVFMYLFLRRLRTTLLVAIAIPVSVVMTFVFMFGARQAGFSSLTLNIMSLMGLMLSIGMLVDNSIVVIESVFRHRQELGEDARTATLAGASEVVLPIAASTLTTMCVFLPLIFGSSGGRFARFMESIGLTVVVVMAASFVVAVTLVPMVSARLLRAEVARPESWFERLSDRYGRTLAFMLRHRAAFTLLTVGALVGSWVLYQNLGRSMTVPSYERQLTILVDAPRSYPLEQRRELYDEIYGTLAAHREELEITDIAHSFQRTSGRTRGHSHSNRFEVYLTDERSGRLTTDEIRDRVEKLLPSRPGVVYTLSRSMRGHMGSGSGVELKLTGDRMEILEVLGGRAVEALRASPGLKDVDSSLESGDEEIRVRPDRERAAQAGLSSQVVGQSVAAALSSRAVSHFEVEDRELDLVVQYREQDRSTLDQLQRMPLRLDDASLPIGALARFDSSPGARAIERENRQATLTVTADVASGMPSFAAQRTAQRVVESLDLPAGYGVTQGEDWFMGAESSSDALFVLGFALILVYMVMASLFESFAHPFVIMFSVPFAFIGVGVVMRLAGQPRSSSSDMGLIILAGIVVNNAIVLVDQINRLRRSGMPRDEAIVLGGRHRLRPILMTAITTILGLSPMVAPFFLPQVFGAVEGRAAFWAPVGLVILGGLTTSTFLTVMVIPTIYSLVDDLTRFGARVVREVAR